MYKSKIFCYNRAINTLYCGSENRKERFCAKKYMKCPICNYPDSKVIDSRPTQDGSSIRRRRECLECQKRFTTFEILETVQIFVRQKRPVNAEEIVSDIETELQNTLTQEINSRELGEMVMRRLKDADKVAYVRFASV